MQIVMIHGQNHRGSTYHIGKMVADALGGTVTVSKYNAGGYGYYVCICHGILARFALDATTAL